ncbi:hypothetical protein CS022_23850 [Veronia nyctiphanis]|uniref:Uncharacterized protein n=1 Tax=Veronia nyctiphanis TaxID=1278244 RepID=A0A4Q0YGI7_9GAMM|nr:beta-ketoacyl synthase N-terminal-like domain-containing protein [Veronia nyctiphanis]RXJ69413.1 hypothetical protein CS022_23850 [Veronia nyctiphanis]
MNQNDIAPAPATPTHHQLALELTQAVAQILKMDIALVTADTDIRDFGFDSINVVELTRVLNERYDVNITPPQLFEHATLASVAEFLLTEYPEQVSAYYHKAVKDKAVTNTLVSQPVSATESTSIRSERRSHEPVAITGLAGSFPGSENLDVFWQKLMAGEDLITEVPVERWDWNKNFGNAMEKTGQTQVKWGGFMPSVDLFDATFFGISAHEANLMDPQQRLFLQTAWHAIENAGYDPEQLKGSKTGVFVGIFTADYNELLIKSGEIKEAHAITGLAHSILPNRLSYLLGLHGPSIPVDTACSSSLVALHQAVESIQSGTCDQALVGGVSVMASQTPFMSASRAGMICADGRCKTFDKRANGYARGEGVGAVLVKPLSQALKDGDHIHAVIRGTATNHGGVTNSLTSLILSLRLM